MNPDKFKQILEATISDLVSNFLYYGRKEDEELGMDTLVEAFKKGEITADSVVDSFKKHLVKQLKENYRL